MGSTVDSEYTLRFMGSQYESDRYADNYPDGIERHYWNVARNAYLFDLIGSSRDQVVLDVGCGRGIVVDYLRRRGVDCWGCDLGLPRPLNDDVAPFLIFGSDASVISEDLAAQVTHLTLLDVLEHLESPEALLSDCRKKFPNAKRYTITLPARLELWTNYDEHFGHFRRYDADSVFALLRCLTPRAVRLEYFFHILYPALLASAAMGIRRKTVLVAPAKPFACLVHQFVGTVIRQTDRIIPKTLPGTSISATVQL